MARRADGEGSIRQRPSDGRWIGRLRVGKDENGKPRLAWASGKNRREVVAKLREAKKRYDDGLIVTPRNESVGEFLDRWLAERRSEVRPSTFSVYEAFVRLDIKPVLGGIPLTRLSVADVDRMLALAAAKSAIGRGGRPRSPQTVNHLRGTLRTALNDAIRQELVTRNVAASAKPRKVERRERPFLKPDEVRALQAALAGDPIEPLVSLALATAMRQGELLALRWEDVDLEAGVIHVRHSLQHISGVRAGERERRWALVAPKTPTSRRAIPMVGAARAALLRQQVRQQSQRAAAGSLWHEEALVFTTGYGGPVDNSTVTKRLQQHLAAAGLPPVGFHALRHTALSWLAAQGVPPRTVMEIAGHSQISVTMNVYSHVVAEQMREAAGQLDALLASG